MPLHEWLLHIPRTLWTTPLFALLISCDSAGHDGFETTAPRAGTAAADLNATAAIPRCDSTCVVALDPRPFIAAHVLPDSAGTPLDLASFTIRGDTNTRVRLQLDVSRNAIAAMHPVGMLNIEVDGTRSSISLAALLTTPVIIPLHSRGRYTRALHDSYRD